MVLIYRKHRGILFYLVLLQYLMSEDNIEKYLS